MMAVPETNRLNKNTHAELTEFHTVPFIREDGMEAQVRQLEQTLNASPIPDKHTINLLGRKQIRDNFFRRPYDITEAV
ncbi:hypothetical protein BWD09_04095 [Neisseria dentiae]|uniref:Uncharacterized protein n=2 Tax=Neisseria dentiae TaxID=194197 RepID=A0A1X3DE01_9NEIS|nr:hypothetical protein [Neisseria dentiae]OSI17942.1 hypothetical protein BWD09_04095 [Neisseria dentiae]QMT45080.1 hypothetical protein H3L92_11875 [Neisseria dentiae]